MKTFNSILLLIIISLNSCGQANKTINKTQDYFASLANKNDVFKNIIIKDISLDDLPLNKYYVLKYFSDIDINQDNNNDLIVILNTRQLESDPFDIKNPSKSNFRILLFFQEIENGKFQLTERTNKILNQNTEGLYGSSFKIIKQDNILILREFGRQIDTDWATDLEFQFENTSKTWFLKRTVSYSAEINASESKVKKPIQITDIKEKIPLDQVNYYDYFPFGFSDYIPQN